MVQKKKATYAIAVLVLVILVVVAAIGGYFQPPHSPQPDIRVTYLSFGSPKTNPIYTTVEGMTASNGSSFGYTATANGTAILVLENMESMYGWAFAKNVTVNYSAPGINGTRYFELPAYTSNDSIQVGLESGQTITGSFNVSGGSKIDFGIEFYTCTESLPFSMVLVNNGTAGGYMTLVLQRQNGAAAYTNKYYVNQGQLLPTNGTVPVNDCSTTTLKAIVNAS